MKVYLLLNSPEPISAYCINGVDYKKGIPVGKVCGKAHEYVTKDCIPVFYTEKEKEKLSLDEKERLVELVPFKATK